MSAGEFYPLTGWRTISIARKSDFDALERILVRYRPPILKELQSRVGRDEDSEELTQEFIHTWLRRDFLKNVDERKGRFRNFIKRCIVNFLRDRHRRQRQEPEFAVIGEAAHADGPVLDPPAELVPGDELIDVEWARRVVDLSLERLEQEFVSTRWGSRFRRLQPFLQDPGADSYAKTAADLGMTEEAVRTAVSRMRQRFGKLIEEEIKENVGPEEDWREELRYFLQLLGRPSPVT